MNSPAPAASPMLQSGHETVLDLFSLALIDEGGMQQFDALLSAAPAVPPLAGDAL